MTVGPDLTYNGGSYDAFVAKIQPDGSGLVYAGYIGGSGADQGQGIAVDGSGAAYVVGYTTSTEATFPVTVEPDLTADGGNDAFVVKVSATPTHTVTPVAGLGGTITPNTPQTVNEGDTIAFTVTPDPDYAIQAVAGCGGALAGNTYTTGPITANCTVAASFRATDATLTVSKAGPGGGTVTGAGIACGADCAETYPVGTAVTLTAAPDGVSTFLGWSGACGGTGTCTVTMDATQNVIAIFGVTTAATLTVNKTADTDDGSCDLVDCSLREAVATANDYDTIDFAPGLAGQTILLGNTITLNKSLMIQGLGAGLLTISNGGAFVSAFVTSGTGIAVIFDNLTFRDGTGLFYNRSGDTLTFTNSVLDQSGGAGTIGGAIFNEGTLTIAGGTLSNHTALEAGAIANEAGASLTIIDSEVTGNRAGRSGGAIRNGSQLTIRNSRLTGNAATEIGVGANGGAILNGGILTLVDSTLANNTAVDFGGGLSNKGTATIRASTLASNSASLNGGGIINWNWPSGGATLTVINSTLSGNSSVGSSGYGGGVFNDVNCIATVSNSTITGNVANFGGGIKNYGPLTLSNNLVAGNTGPSGGQEIWVEVGNWNSQGHNLIGQNNDPGMGDGTILAVPGPTDFTSTTALNTILNPLAANGGPTQTHLLVAGSPALDAGNNALIPSGVTTDQRGVARIQNGTVDVGVVEGSSTIPTLSINNVSQAEGNSGTTAFIFTVTLSAVASLPVTVDWATANGTATAGSDYTAAAGALTFPVGGPLTQTLTVQVTGDTLVEPNETFIVNLSNPVNATLAVAQGTGTIVNDDSSTDRSGVAWSGDLFVVVRAGGAVLTSPNGVTWTPRVSGTVQNLAGIAWSGSQFVAVGDGGTILTSAAGVAWTPVTPPPTIADLYSIAWSGTQFAAVGTGGAIFTSPDGGTWTARTSGATQDLYGVTWTGDRFMAVGDGGAIITSATGATWVAQTAGTTADLYGVAWSGSQVVVVGSGGNVLTSATGAAWTPQNAGTTADLYGVAWSGGRFVAAGGGGVLLTSPDGAAWTAQAAGTTEDLYSVAWSGDRFLAVGTNAARVTVAHPWGDDRSLPSNRWTMLGLPATPTAPSTVQSVFGASLPGAYGADWTVWRREATADQYVLLELTDPVAPGAGYWLRKTSAGAAMLVLTAGAATPVTLGPPNCLAGCYELALIAPAGAEPLFNLVGMPFPYPVGWWEVRVEVDGTVYPLDAARDPVTQASYVAPTYWVWNGNGYDSYDSHTPGMVGLLQPW